jgi:hypothetical protein
MAGNSRIWQRVCVQTFSQIEFTEGIRIVRLTCQTFGLIVKMSLILQANMVKKPDAASIGTLALICILSGL